MESDQQTPDYEQFTRLFLSAQREILRYVLALVPDLDDAHDIVQETAVALWRKIDQYDPSQPFVPWACRFALIEARDFQRKSQRWSAFASDHIARRVIERQQQLDTQLKKQNGYLRACLKQLTQAQHNTIEAYYFERVPVAELAEAQHTSPAAIYKSLQRIRRSLMNCVRRHAATEGA